MPQWGLSKNDSLVVECIAGQLLTKEMTPLRSVAFHRQVRCTCRDSFFDRTNHENAEAAVIGTARLRIWIFAALVTLMGCASVEQEVDDSQGSSGANGGNLDAGDPDIPQEPDSTSNSDSDRDADVDPQPDPDTGNDDDAPDVDEANGDVATDAENEGDVDVEMDVDVGDPCDACASYEVCDGTLCIDLCTEQERECGVATSEHGDIDCGDCPAGACDDGQCPDLCSDFLAECGEVYWSGVAHDCGSCSGTTRCMHNQCTSNEGFIDITAGRSHSCGLRPNGELRCWGRNEYGQLGDTNLPDDASSPSAVYQIHNAATVATLNNHSCTVLDDDHVHCWGRNESDQLGNGTLDNASSPVQATNVTATSVATGGSHSCALLQAEKMLCWGNNDFGQRGTGTSFGTPDHQKQRVLYQGGDEFDEVVQISLGSGHSCAVRRDNTLWCWGFNQSGQLGQGDNTDGPSFAELVSGMEAVQYVSAGFQHTCAITVGGDLYCWGRGGFGELGNGTGSDHFEPKQVELDEPVVDVASGRFHTCAAVESGDVYCWGRNDSGQIGQNTMSGQYDEPQWVSGVDDVHRVSAGGEHSCALDRGGNTHCWGGNEYGQLGDGTETPRSSPVSVVP